MDSAYDENPHAKICCVLVHGWRLLPWTGGEWTRPASRLRTSIERRVPGVSFHPFEWSGSHRQAPRHQAAEQLKSRLSTLSHQYDKVFVIGHSHGGNVALQAVQLLGSSPIAIATMATPFLKTRIADARQNLRVVFATCLALFFLLGIGYILIRGDFREIATIIQVVVLFTLFAAAILTSGSWFPILTEPLAARMIRRRRLYEYLELTQPIEMLIIYDPKQDEVTKFFTSLRRGILSAAKFFRRAGIHAEIESDRWLANSPNFALAVCVGLAGLLTIPTILSGNSQYRLISAIGGLVLVFVGLSIWIWKSFRAGVSVAIVVFLVFLNGFLKIIYSWVKSGHLFDFISVLVRTRFFPTSSHSRFCIEKKEIDVVSRRLFARIHRGIAEDCRVVDALATWIAAKSMSTR